MAWRDRVRGILNQIGDAVSGAVGGEQQGGLQDYDEEEPYEVIEPTDIPVEQPEEVPVEGPIVDPNDPDSRGPVAVYDDEGEYVGTHTYSQWIDLSLLNGSAFMYEFGNHHFVMGNRKPFVNLILAHYGITWSPADWQAWRNEYEARNG